MMNERTIIQRVTGMPTSDGAGVSLTRVIGQPALSMLDPFLLLDEIGSDEPTDYVAGFPEHPHRGFETVTYMLAGRMRHGDNQGNSGLLTAGSVQWMTAGRGIVHSEMPEQQEGLLHGFQLWVNLPASDKMTAPRYQDIAPERIPEVEPQAGVRVRVVAGTFGTTTGPVGGVATEPVFLDVALARHAGVAVPLPVSHHAFVYVFDGGEVMIDDKRLDYRQLGVLGGGDRVTLRAGDKSVRLLLVAGKPLGEPVARYGPFVMNSNEELHQAVADYQAGRF